MLLSGSLTILGGCVAANSSSLWLWSWVKKPVKDGDTFVSGSVTVWEREHLGLLALQRQGRLQRIFSSELYLALVARHGGK